MSFKPKKAPPIIGVSESIRRINDLIDHVADTGLNIVISGESGVGKEVVAHNLYQRSPRFGQPFVKVNCAALPEGLLESELFGYEQGAFTGAERKKRGKFELAHGGVLLLDEIGDMSLMLQSKLLHVLQSGEFAPLGSEKEFKTDAWIIAATNHELEEDIKNEKFREDLYYRLNIIKIYIPPLRSRPEDIPPLIDYYIKQYSNQFAGREINSPEPDYLEKLQMYHWPGNVRELQNILKRYLVVRNWEEIVNELLHAPYCKNEPAGLNTDQNKITALDELIKSEMPETHNLSSLSLKKIKKKTLDRVEKEVISYVLKKTGWNRSKATKILKISYKTLLYKIQDLEIEPPTNFKDY